MDLQIRVGFNWYKNRPWFYGHDLDLIVVIMFQANRFSGMRVSCGVQCTVYRKPEVGWRSVSRISGHLHVSRGHLTDHTHIKHNQVTKLNKILEKSMEISQSLQLLKMYIYDKRCRAKKLDHYSIEIKLKKKKKQNLI